MRTYTIGEVAERTGFSASALRYYEGIGLVEPSTRTDAGYRLYDDRTLDRLTFIDRAKRLGCTLEEIGDLVGLLDGDRCGPVQRRLHDLVTAKVAAAGREIDQLTSFAAELQAAAAQLGGDAVDGPCREGCACLAVPASSAEAVATVRVACTLGAAELPGRVAEWREMAGRARSRSTLDDGAVRLGFGDDVGLEELARLVAAEQSCCAFFSFTVTVDAAGVSLEVRAPEEAAGIVGDMLGLPA